jgi:hypothetical protein
MPSGIPQDFVEALEQREPVYDADHDRSDRAEDHATGEERGHPRAESRGA